MKSRYVYFVMAGMCLTMLSLTGCHQAESPVPFPDPTLADFHNPPLVARPGVLWPWLNGYVDRKELVRELQELKAKGLRGAILWDIGTLADPEKMIPVGPAFLGKESLESIHLAMDEASKLGLELGLFASSSWNAGGSWITPADASKAVIFSDTLVSGPADYRDSLPLPQGATAYYSEICVMAVPVDGPVPVDRKNIRNISSDYRDRILTWKVPRGTWKIIRFICNNTGQPLMCPSPNSKGPMIDHLSAKAADAHLDYMISAIRGDRKDFGPMRFFMLDSYEVDPADDWTPEFGPQFQRMFGYDITPWMPALAGTVIDNDGMTRRFLHDYHKAVGNMIVDNHFKEEKKVLHNNGLLLLAEAGHGGYARVDPLKALGVADIPMGEFWNGSQFWVTKEAASASHIYGNNIVNAESFTGWRAWKDGPAHYKQLFDVALCEGLNQVTVHTFAHNPPEAGLPGFVYHAGEHFNVNSTWWPYAGPMVEYMSRCCYLLQQGQFVGDLCLYIGDKAPNLVPPRRIDPNLTPKYDSTKCWHCGQDNPVSIMGLGRGYDYDYIDEEVILNRMQTAHGRLTLPRELSYRVMVLPDTNAISPDVLRKLEKLIREGAVVYGPKPDRSNSLKNYPNCDKEVRELGEKIWGECDGVRSTSHPYGKGKVIYGIPLWKVMKDLGVPRDFSVSGVDNSDHHIDFIHRRTSGSDIYFVSNSDLQYQTFTATFRIPESRKPTLWLADKGVAEKCAVLRADSVSTEVTLSLPPAGSVFVIFSDQSSDAVPVASVVSYNPDKFVYRTVAVPGHPWKLDFPDGRGAPKEMTIDQPGDWTKSPIDGVRFFSGTATYSVDLNVPDTVLTANRELLLDLGDVREVAVVRLNGTVVDTLWKQPFTTNVGRYLKPGGNRLEVDVTNLWNNRLVGDAGKPAGERFTRTNIQNKYRGDMPLLPSGLMGPVRLLTPVEEKGRSIN
jgi:hypothetical protein